MKARLERMKTELERYIGMAQTLGHNDVAEQLCNALIHLDLAAIMAPLEPRVATKKRFELRTKASDYEALRRT